MNRCFTKNWLNNCINFKTDKYYLEIARRYIENLDTLTNYEVIQYIYNLMSKEYRNEYFYKNSILNSILIKKHNPNTTVALSEFSVANSLADFVMINGKGSVYEIKTELDNLDRLENQINDYYKGFTYVSIVTYKKNKDKLKEILDKYPNVGLLFLKNKNVVEDRKATYYAEQLDAEVLFKMLRKKEFEEVILKCGSSLPQINQFEYYTACKKIFESINIDDLQKNVMTVLKNRISITTNILGDIPYELKFICYIANIDEKQNNMLNIFLNKKWGEVF